jgi:SAM-dependent methyltransferase
MIKALLKKIPGVGWLRAGWPDEARVLIQSAALHEVLDGRELAGTCLNAGCGEGLYAPFLDRFPQLRRIVHMDVVWRGVADRYSDGRHEERVGSVTDLPFGSGEFDACLCTEVMEHVEEHEKGFAELARVLKPGGLLVISTPTPPAPFDSHHVREGYTYEEMRGHLERHGFEALRHAYCFHWMMRALYVFWNWQFETLGRGKRSWLPRFFVYIAGVLDRDLPFGKPWDMVVLARRRSEAEA